MPRSSSSSKRTRTRASASPSSETEFDLSAYSSKGLKSLSVKVLKLLQDKVHSSYSDIADELVDLSVEKTTGEYKRVRADTNNVRRRVYDVLNVLVAMGLLEKDKKNLTWMGDFFEDSERALGGSSESAALADKRKDRPKPASVPEKKDDEKSRKQGLLHLDKKELLERVNAKRQQLSALLVRQIMLYELVKSNAARAQPSSKINLPFVIVSASSETNCEVRESEKTHVIATFDGPFEVHDDMEVLTRMNIMEKVSQRTIRSIVPPDLFELLPPPLRAKVLGLYTPQPDLAQDEEKAIKLEGEVEEKLGVSKIDAVSEVNVDSLSQQMDEAKILSLFSQSKRARLDDAGSYDNDEEEEEEEEEESDN